MKNDDLIRATTIVRTISETTPHTFGDNHRNAGWQAGDQVVTWQDGGGFYACLQGIEAQGGNWYETDDLGPFPTREAAEEAALDYYETRNEE